MKHIVITATLTAFFTAATLFAIHLFRAATDMPAIGCPELAGWTAAPPKQDRLAVDQGARP